MDITPLLRESQKIVQSYAAGRFRISGEVWEGAVLVEGERVSPWIISDTTSPLADRTVFARLSGEIDVLLIGLGDRGGLLTPAVRQIYRDLGFSVEVMDTRAACRTFNVLNSEGRRVAAALIPVTGA